MLILCCSSQNQLLLPAKDVGQYETLKDLIEDIRQKHLTEETFQFMVSREFVIRDALKRTLKPTFDCCKKIEVIWVVHKRMHGYIMHFL